MKPAVNLKKSMQNKTFVVIGNSAAGLAGIEAIRKLDKNSRIINISQEPYRPYSRCLLSYYLAGLISQEQLWIRPANYYKDLGVEPLLGCSVEAIDRKNKTLKLKKGNELNYDKLLFAAGSSAKQIEVAGVQKKGVFCLRTLDDAKGILSLLGEAKDAVILGGGLIGLRVACALKKRGIRVRVIVKSSSILSQILDVESADMIMRRLKANGVEILIGRAAQEILGKDRVKAVVLDDASRLDAELVIIAKGVSANSQLLEKNSENSQDEAIPCDEYMKTKDPAVFVAGDVALTYDIFKRAAAMNAIWPNAVRQGKLAGLNIAGENIAYEGACAMNAVDFFGYPVISFGIIKARGNDFEELIQRDPSRSIYRKVVIRDKRIIGCVIANDIQRHGILLNLAKNAVDISSIKNLLVDEYFDFAKVIPLIKKQKAAFKQPEYSDVALSYAGIKKLFPVSSFL